MLSNSELNDLEDFAKNGYSCADHDNIKELILLAVKELRTNRQPEPLLSAKQLSLGEITQDMLDKYYVYLEVSGSNELVFTITPSGNERVVFVRTASGERIRLTSTLAIGTSVPK